MESTGIWKGIENVLYWKMAWWMSELSRWNLSTPAAVHGLIPCKTNGIPIIFKRTLIRTLNLVKYNFT